MGESRAKAFHCTLGREGGIVGGRINRMIDKSMDARTNRFLEGFSPTGCEQVVGQLIYQTLPAGEYLFREGDAADGVCLVLEGEVEIVKAAGHHEEILGCFKAGD